MGGEVGDGIGSLGVRGTRTTFYGALMVNDEMREDWRVSQIDDEE